MTTGRVISFDYGLKHIGVAVGNESIGSAVPLKALGSWTGSADNFAKMDAIIKEWSPEFLVVGLPQSARGLSEQSRERHLDWEDEGDYFDDEHIPIWARDREIRGGKFSSNKRGHGKKANKGQSNKNEEDPSAKVAQGARKFAQDLVDHYHLTVYFKDERYSSTAAKEEIFNYNGGYRSLVKDKGRIDSVAACIILEGFFEVGGRHGNFEALCPVQDTSQ